MASSKSQFPADSAGSSGPQSGNTQKSAAKQSHSISSSLPPAKRSRKAINCQPCRASKLKCDRSRPCSSCVLRGTTALCYPDGPPDIDSSVTPEHSRSDPQLEIQKIRHALYNLETHFAGKIRPSDSAAVEAVRHSSADPLSSSSPLYSTSAPSAQDIQTDAGLYAGPTSSVFNLFGLKHSNSFRCDPFIKSEPQAMSINSLSMVQEEEDEELISRLPAYHVVDRVLQFYANSCCVMNLFVQRTPLLQCWEKYKNGEGRTRLSLSLIFVTIAVAIQFLPPRDEIFLYLRRDHIGSIAELSDWFYEQSFQALSLHESVSTMPSLELVEVYLVQINYLSISKNHAEQVWRLRGIVTSNAIALGLHRDPRKWNFPHSLAERRRWAWFNVLRVERWLSFMLGRPVVFNNNQFDCLFPSTSDPGCLDQVEVMDHQPFIHMFRLMILFGDIMNDLTSMNPVPYESILAHDCALEDWMNSFPPSLRMDVKQLSEAFKGVDTNRRNQGVQTVCLRLAGLHTRLALHRPFATKYFSEPDQAVDDSLRIATEASIDIIRLIAACQQSYLTNPVLTVPGHIHWGVLHSFAALIFLAFQVVSCPGQINSKHLQDQIADGLLELEALQGIPAADKAITIIRALQPLYSSETSERADLTEGKREYILKTALHLPVPFVDSPIQHTQRVHKSISPVVHSQSITPMQHNYAHETHPMPNLQMGLYDRAGPILPSQIPTNPRDDTYWSSAVGIETNDWSRFMQEVLPKSEYQTGS